MNSAKDRLNSLVDFTRRITSEDTGLTVELDSEDIYILSCNPPRLFANFHPQLFLYDVVHAVENIIGGTILRPYITELAQTFEWGGDLEGHDNDFNDIIFLRDPETYCIRIKLPVDMDKQV